MAHGFRHVPRDRKHIEHLRPFGSRFEVFYQTMPMLHFEPFPVDNEEPGGDKLPPAFVRPSHQKDSTRLDPGEDQR